MMKIWLGSINLDQHDAEQQVLAGELQFGEGIAGHGAEQHGADHPEDDEQTGVDVEVQEGKARQGGDEVVEVPLGGQDLGREWPSTRPGS